MVTVTAVATCCSCAWTQTGEPTVVDMAADRHATREHHPTTVHAVPNGGTQ